MDEAETCRQKAEECRAMAEQTSAAKELTQGVTGVKAQSEQAAKAAAEQARTMKEIAKAAEQSSRDIRTVAKDNQKHSKGMTRIVGQLNEIRRITQRNAEGVGRTRTGTAELIDQARALAMQVNAPNGKSPNGRTGR